MQGADLDRLEKLEEGLALLFYVLMFVAFVEALSGATGSGFLMLILGSCAHVGRAALAEFVERQRAREPRRVVRAVPDLPQREVAADRPHAARAARSGVRLGR